MSGTSQRLRVVVLSPDRHIEYDGRTPASVGVGGGITVRVRLAAALVRAGHDVVHACSTPVRERQDGVLYVPFDQCADEVASPDVLVAQSSGGALDLTPAAELAPGARLRLARVAGPAPLRGLQAYDAHAYVVPSVFLAQHLTEAWQLPAQQVHVIPNGVPSISGWGGLRRTRDRFRLVYSSHPSKGLDTAVRVLQLLRSRDPRWSLHVFGGDQLWGGVHRPRTGDGVVDHGMVGQDALNEQLGRAAFSLHLQTFEEGFGIALSEAMAAGCVPVASPVGAFPERVRDGENGILLDGDPTGDDVVARAADAIERVNRSPLARRAMQRRARASVLDWDAVAQRFVELFRRHLDGAGAGAGAQHER